ncbi:MAG: NDP-sugar synthase [Dethiobacter sp.]|nr:NDP-sugar synthase [Dethiobacter sp.]
MKAMILAAGLGTRLRPLTNTVSKPMVQMAGRPCMEHTVRLLARHGISEIVVNLHYLPEIIREHFGDGSKFGVSITYSYEDVLMGTAGGFKRLEKFFEDETALIVSGDALTDIDLINFYSFHKECKGVATLALKRVADPTQYGVVVKDGERIVRFQEKPGINEAVSSLANTGIYLFEPAIFDEIPDGVFYDFGRQVFPQLLAKKKAVYGYEMKEYWCDVGDLSVYREAHYDMLAGVVEVELPGKRFDANIWLGQRVAVHPDTVLVGPVLIGDNCTVEAGARIYGPVILGNNSRIGRNAVIKRGILWNNVIVGEEAELSDSIVAEGCVVPAGALVKNEVLEKEELSLREVAATKEE